MDCLRVLVVPGEMPWSAATLGFDSPKVVCYVPFKIGHAPWQLFSGPGRSVVASWGARRRILTIEPSAGSFMMMGGFSVM